MGVSVSKDQLQSEMVNTPGFETGDDDRRNATERALADLLLVIQGFQRGASAIKVSEPMVKRELAMLGQTVTVNVVDFPASKYADKVPAPTAEQLKAEFDKYSDVIKGTTSAENPFGFGYKYPHRLKLQYIALPREAVRKTVEASKSPYEWRVEAQKYYIQHQKEFESAPGGKSFSMEAPATRPTTQPFAAVEEKVRNQLIDAASEARTKAILDRINTALSGDWVAYHNAPAGATTAPSSLSVPYDSFEYLQKLAASVQTDFKVQPTVVSLAEKWLDGDSLAKVPGLGAAVAALDVGEVPASLYLMARSAAFLPSERREEPGVIQLFEPSRPLRDSAQTTYIARVSAADPTHKPATLAEVEPAVRGDVVTAKAYEMAKADAEKLLEQARQKGSLKAAAGGSGVVTVGPLTNRNDQPVPALFLAAGPGATQFIGSAFDMLAGAGTTAAPTTASATTTSSVATTTRSGGGDAKPLAIISLPREGRAFVAELANVEATFTQRSLAFEATQVQVLVTGRFEENFIRNWFNFPSLTSRLNFVPDPSFKESESPAPPPPPQAPIF